MIEPFFLLMRWGQTIPPALLLMAAFEDEELRVRRWVGTLLSGVYMFLMCVPLAWVSAAASVNGSRNIAARDLSLAAAMAIFFCCWAAAVRAPAARKMMVAVLALHYAAMLNALGNLFTALILGEGYLEAVNADAGSVTFDLCLLAVTALTYPLVWCFFRRVLRKNLPVLGNHRTWRGLGYLCVVFLLFCTATYMPSYQNQPEATVMLGSLVATDMIAYYIFFQEIGAVRRQAETARQLADYRLQYQSFASRVEGVRQLRHDLHHHLNMLGSLNAQGRSDDLALYLKEYGKVYEQLEQQEFCGNPAVDSVLGYYLSQAKEEGIPFECQMPLWKGGGVKDMDMTVLLGNCLENAMEAVGKLPAGQGRIRIELQPVGGMLLIRLVNSCGAGQDSAGFQGWAAFPSSKAEGREGVGLRSISGIAEKYGGSAQFQRKDGEFTTRVTLSMCPDDLESAE